ncbi:MAG: AAA family ATPase [Firmicutes bacterium]|nr:AAA family ATPase [Bacillota bacterium]
MGAERPLNPEQQASIRKALGQEVAFIWGPPGTGKTSTLARLVEELVAAGERVLIASHTNAAVDVAFEPVAERLSPDAREQGATVRVGTPQRRSELVQQNTLDAIVERRSAGLQAERQAAERRKEDLERRLQDIEAALGALEGVRRADAALRAARDAHTQAQQALEAARSEAAAAHAQITALRARLQEAEGMGWLRRALTGMHPATIRQKLAEAEQAGLASAQRVVVRQQEADAAVAALRQAEAAYRAALARRERLGVTADEGELRRRQRETTEALQSAQRRLAEIDAAIAALARVILREARVVATTLARLSIMDELLAEPYDTVVVDEASIIPVPYVWLAALVAKRRVVVAGDFRQLPPIAMGEDEKRYPRAARRLARDVFAAAGIVEEGRIRKEDRRLAKLSRQYRMHPDIGGLVNVLVYERDENKLHHEVDARSDHVRRGLHAPPEPGHPLVLCDTSDANPWCAKDTSRSRYNLYSAVVAVRLAALAVASHPDLTVGLVTPYRAQVRLLQTLAEHYSLASDRVRIATVHRFQGDQQDVIILDLVDGPPHAIGRMLKGGHVSPATRLLNVACSRARGKLVVVAHTAHLGRLTAGHSLIDLLGYLGHHGRWLDARAVLARHDDPDVMALAGVVHREGTPLPSGAEPGLYNETAFFSAFRQDLAAARHQVVIFSPYIHVNRLAQLVPHLRAAVERGVQVAVVTRFERGAEGDGVGLHQELARIGVRIVPRSNLHEKLAVIDGRVAWFGSLNILSHSRSTEWMMRFGDPPVVQRLAEVTGAVR